MFRCFPPWFPFTKFLIIVVYMHTETWSYHVFSSPYRFGKPTINHNDVGKVRHGTRLFGHQELNHPADASVVNHNNFRPSVTDNARTVMNVCNSATLCTTTYSNDEVNNAPFGSHVDYILDEVGWPVLLLSDQSLHTQNIHHNPMLSLFCQLPRPDNSETSAALSRVTYIGSAEKVKRDDLLALKLAFTLIHPHTEQLAESPSFSFYKIRPMKIYYSAGFGVMAAWVNISDYENAKPDAIAHDVPNVLSRVNLEKQNELGMLCKQFLGISDTLERVRIEAVDRLGIDLRVQTGKLLEQTFPFSSTLSRQ